MSEHWRGVLANLIGVVDPDSRWDWAEKVLTETTENSENGFGMEVLRADNNRLLLAALTFFGPVRVPGHRGWPMAAQKALPFLTDGQTAELTRKISWLATQPGYRESFDRSLLRVEANISEQRRERLL